MKIILAILALVFLNSCALIKSKEEKELEILSKNYGGFYVFDRKAREEILQREKERDEYMDDFFKRHKYFTVSDLEVLNKI
ncbi:hypothetical protein H2278_06390, partial [Campylobacter sp. W0018]|nr:hypothetical protein [Campylobacter sp. W0018]